jgi:Acyl-CoA dehydrogenase, C-terminal domain
VTTHSRVCVNQLFEASGASQALLSADLQRYFRDINVLHQHAALQPNSTNELYGRLLAWARAEHRTRLSDRMCIQRWNIR